MLPQPTPFNIGLTDHILAGPRLANWPNESSKKKTGSPTNANMMTYGMRKAPPPFRNAKYGNLHTLPSPTAYPTQVRMNSNCPPQFPLSMFSGPSCPSSPEVTVVAGGPEEVGSPLDVIVMFKVDLLKVDL